MSETLPLNGTTIPCKTIHDINNTVEEILIAILQGIFNNYFLLIKPVSGKGLLHYTGKLPFRAS